MATGAADGGVVRPSRDARIDTLRGLALVLITTSHTPYPWHPAVPDALGFAGVAQTFLFLSGLVAGLVYTRLAGRLTGRELRAKALRRVGLIWSVHALSCVALVVVVNAGHALGSGWLPAGGALLLDHPALAATLGAAGLHVPGFTDILPLYCVLALLTPVVVLGMVRGRTALVLGASLALWLSAQLGLEDRVLAAIGTKVPVYMPFFRLTGWQILFVGGIALGVAWARGTLSRIRIGPWLALACLAGHAVLFLVKHEIWPDGVFARTLRRFAMEPTHGPVLILDFVLLATAVSWLAHRVPRLFTWSWLALLGRHSLAVFCFHLLAMWSIALLEIEALPLQLALTGLAIAGLTIPAHFAERRRERRRATSPASPEASAPSARP
jgi:hypothetical protein